MCRERKIVLIKAAKNRAKKLKAGTGHELKACITPAFCFPVGVSRRGEPEDVSADGGSGTAT